MAAEALCTIETDPKHLGVLVLLTPDQHVQISAWIAHADTPEEIPRMPTALWRAVERASEVMGIDQDLIRPPSLDAEGIN